MCGADWWPRSYQQLLDAAAQKTQRLEASRAELFAAQRIVDEKVRSHARGSPAPNRRLSLAARVPLSNKHADQAIILSRHILSRRGTAPDVESAGCKDSD